MNPVATVMNAKFDDLNLKLILLRSLYQKTLKIQYENQYEELFVTTWPVEDILVDDSQQQITSRFEWRNYKEAQSVKMLNAFYDKVVIWRKNIFLLPSGKSGKQYTNPFTHNFVKWSTYFKHLAWSFYNIMRERVKETTQLKMKDGIRSHNKETLNSLKEKLCRYRRGNDKKSCRQSMMRIWTFSNGCRWTEKDLMFK